MNKKYKSVAFDFDDNMSEINHIFITRNKPEKIYKGGSVNEYGNNRDSWRPLKGINDTVISDPVMTLGDMDILINKLIEKYGNNAIITTYSGYNNVDINIIA